MAYSDKKFRLLFNSRADGYLPSLWCIQQDSMMSGFRLSSASYRGGDRICMHFCNSMYVFAPPHLYIIQENVMGCTRTLL